MIVIREDGTNEVVEGRKLALGTLQAAVGGYIEIVAFADGSASLIAHAKGRPMTLVGPVAFLSAAEVEALEEDDA